MGLTAQRSCLAHHSTNTIQSAFFINSFSFRWLKSRSSWIGLFHSFVFGMGCLFALPLGGHNPPTNTANQPIPLHLHSIHFMNWLRRLTFIKNEKEMVCCVGVVWNEINQRKSNQFHQFFLFWIDELIVLLCWLIHSLTAAGRLGAPFLSFQLLRCSTSFTNCLHQLLHCVDCFRHFHSIHSQIVVGWLLFLFSLFGGAIGAASAHNPPQEKRRQPTPPFNKNQRFLINGRAPKAKKR